MLGHGRRLLQLPLQVNVTCAMLGYFPMLERPCAHLVTKVRGRQLLVEQAQVHAKVATQALGPVPLLRQARDNVCNVMLGCGHHFSGRRTHCNVSHAMGVSGQAKRHHDVHLVLLEHGLQLFQRHLRHNALTAVLERGVLSLELRSSLNASCAMLEHGRLKHQRHVFLV